MSADHPVAALQTHDVVNQPASRSSLDLVDGDALLRTHLDRLPPQLADTVSAYAHALGEPEMVSAGHRLATGHGPTLVQFDAGGRRVDHVRYGADYHRLMDLGLRAGYAALPWSQSSGGHAAHAAMVYLATQIEPGTCCPMTMTYAAFPALAGGDGPLARQLAAKTIIPDYDPRDVPLAQKSAATLGMAMTEKQGGSDVRANSTRAEPEGDGFRLIGHKWFCSAPMSDAFLTLAQRPEGLTCFIVPRWRPDGTRNPIHLMRLKDKLGNRANASAEIEYHGAWAERLGTPGDGIRTILDMVHHTRLDTAIAPVGLMRRALDEALYWTRHRDAFGGKLIDKPLMVNLLADLTLEWAGAFALAMRVARAFDAAAGNDGERAFSRLAVAIAKYCNNKRCILVVAEAMEILGGMGYVEDTPMPWLYREAPLNGIWEGSGNVIALDVLRTLAKNPTARDAVLAELDAARGCDPAFDAALAELPAALSSPAEADARAITERLALLLQTAALADLAPERAAPFARSRLGIGLCYTLGTLPAAFDHAALLAWAGAGP